MTEAGMLKASLLCNQPSQDPTSRSSGELAEPGLVSSLPCLIFVLPPSPEHQSAQDSHLQSKVEAHA